MRAARACITTNAKLDHSGWWNLKQATACILFGDPEQSLPRPVISSDEEALSAVKDWADEKEVDLRFHGPAWTAPEEILKNVLEDPRGRLLPLMARAQRHGLERSAAYSRANFDSHIQSGRLRAYGIPQPGGIGTDKKVAGEHIAIQPSDLLGTVTINSPLDPPSESWLRTRDQDMPGGHKAAWRAVRVPVNELVQLCRGPLIQADAASDGSPDRVPANPQHPDGSQRNEITHQETVGAEDVVIREEERSRRWRRNELVQAIVELHLFGRIDINKILLKELSRIAMENAGLNVSMSTFRRALDEARRKINEAATLLLDGSSR